MAQEKESLVESHWPDFQPQSSSAMIYRREVIPRQRALSALLIGLGIIVTLVLLLVLSYFMHIYSSDHSHINSKFGTRFIFLLFYFDFSLKCQFDMIFSRHSKVNIH